MRAGRFDGRRIGVVVGAEFDGVAKDKVVATASGSLSVTGNELGTDAPNREVWVMYDSWACGGGVNDGKDVSLVVNEERLVVEETVLVPEGNAITGSEDELIPLPDPDVELLTVPLGTLVVRPLLWPIDSEGWL
jgi:hypothetical protein